jgi:nitrate/nitrite transporter NarK
VLLAVNGMLIGGQRRCAAVPAGEARDRRHPHRRAAVLRRAIAGILSMQVGGRLADAVGARTVSLYALPVLIAAAVTIALAPRSRSPSSAWSCWVLGNGAMDVGMNASASRSRRPAGGR